MTIYGNTDVGRVRQSNQDAYLCGQVSDQVYFAVVCDGMGGVNGGNVASAIAVKVISEKLAEGCREGMEEAYVRDLLLNAIAAANTEVFEASMADLSLHGMGTTVVAVVVDGEQAYMAHVGDSRAYIVSGTDNTITQVTKDHTIVQTMVEKGQLTQSEAKHHPRKHFITRALGVEERVECDYTSFTIHVNSALLLCTDGLTSMVEPEEIKNIVLEMEADEVPDRLIAAANMNGGSDNITVVILFHFDNQEFGGKLNG